LWENMALLLVGRALLSKALIQLCADGCGWTIKKAEHQRIDAFELWC